MCTGPLEIAVNTEFLLIFDTGIPFASTRGLAPCAVLHGQRPSSRILQPGQGDPLLIAVVLCAGRAKRMWPLREDKWAIELLGRPLVQHVVDRLLAVPVDEFVFVGNESNTGLLKFLTGELTKGKSHYVVQHRAAGTAGALEAAVEHLSGPFLLVSSDDVVERDAYRAVASRTSSSDDVVVLSPDTGQSDVVHPCVHYHRDPSLIVDALSRLGPAPEDRYESALGLLVAEGRSVRAVQYGGFWQHLRYPWGLLPIMDHLLRDLSAHVAPTAQVSDLARLEGSVHVADGARVLEHAVIRGPAYVGQGAVVGNNSLLRGGVNLGPRSVVGFSTEVKHSHIGTECWFHTNYIGDSIIDDCCAFGSGATTANLRLDGEHVRATIQRRRIDTGTTKLGVIMGAGCRIGINAGLMPGVLVGPGAIIGPHVCLTANLAKGQRAMPSHGYRVEDAKDAAPGPSSYVHSQVV